MLEEYGYRRHQAKHLTRVYIVEVLQHPRDEKGRLRDLRRPEVRSPLDQMRDLCRKRGVPEVLIDSRARELLAQAQPIRRRRPPRGR